MNLVIFVFITLLVIGCESHHNEPPKNIMYPEGDAHELCPPDGASRVK